MPAVLICVIGAVSLPAGPAAVIEPGQAAFGGLFVLMGEVEAGFVHGFADHVVADISGAAEAVAQVAGVHGPHGGHGVALDAGDLDQAADGVAGEAQVMLQGDFCGVLHLIQVEAVELCQAAGGHGAGHAHLCLAAAFGAGDGGVSQREAGGQQQRFRGQAPLLPLPAHGEGAEKVVS